MTLDRRPVGRLEQLRDDLPDVAAGITQLVVDNPAQVALMTAGTVVIARAAFNIVRPRTVLEALALAVVLQIGLPRLASAALEHGWIKFKVRDAHGCLVPLVDDDAEPVSPA